MYSGRNGNYKPIWSTVRPCLLLAELEHLIDEAVEILEGKNLIKYTQTKTLGLKKIIVYRKLSR
jgi:hypothetical protein